MREATAMFGFGAAEVDTRLRFLAMHLPDEVTIPTRNTSVTSDAFVRVIRGELVPFVTYGPDFVHKVSGRLEWALGAFRRGDGLAFMFELECALRDAVAARAERIEPYTPEARTVTATDWCVSYETGSNLDCALLNVHDFNEGTAGGLGVVVRHPVYDGLTFASTADANEFAYWAGLVKRYAPRTAQA